MTSAVSFEGVSKTFTLEHARPRSFKEAFVARFRGTADESEQLVALDDVSFRLEHGGTLGLVGPNGTGKSTTLKLIARILEPDAGRVTIDGRVAALLELGAGFHPDLTGRENVYLNGSLLGLSRGEMAARLDDIVAFAELERFIDMPVKHYSSGMYMRLGFATAIQVDPDILLIDEVLAVGDQAFQHKCRERITALRKAGVTIVLVSHDPTAVRDLCERALWLEDGRVQAFGPTDDVLEAYRASVVAREEARFEAEAEAQGTTAARVGAGDDDHWGSGEVEITAVDVLGPDGRVHPVVESGQPMTVRLRYNARRRIERPVFGLAIHRDDGLHVNGPNTRDVGFEIPAVDGRGEVRYEVGGLPLLEGTYELSASCYDHTCTHAYDHHHRRFRFRVRGGEVSERLGLVYIDAQWRHRPQAPGAGDDGGDDGDAAGVSVHEAGAASDTDAGAASGPGGGAAVVNGGDGAEADAPEEADAPGEGRSVAG